MDIIGLFSNLWNNYPQVQVMSTLVLAVMIIILFIVIIALAIKISHLKNAHNEEFITSYAGENVTTIVNENDEDDEIEEEDVLSKDQIEEIEASIINFDETKVEDTKITTPRKMNLRLRLNSSSNALKTRYSKLRNYLESYKLRHSFLKHRDIYFVDEEVIVQFGGLDIRIEDKFFGKKGTSLFAKSPKF